MSLVRGTLLAMAVAAIVVAAPQSALANHCVSQSPTQFFDAGPLMQNPNGSNQSVTYQSCYSGSSNKCNDYFIMNVPSSGTFSMSVSGASPTVYFALQNGTSSTSPFIFTCSSTSFNRTLSAGTYRVSWRQGGNSGGGPWNPYTLNMTAPAGWTIQGANNTNPTITAIGNQTTNEDVPTGPLGFTVGDAEEPAGGLVVSATSSNTTVLPQAGIVLGGSGANRTINLTPGQDQSGSSNVVVTVADSGGLTATESFTLTVNPVNDAPTAAAVPAGQANYTGNEGTPIAVDGTSSSDPEGPIASWAWDCDNDGNYNDATGSTATCPAPDDGTFTIGLQVTDGSGLTATATATAVIANVAPTASMTGAATANEGTTETYTASATDPSPVDQAALTYAWDLQDPTGVSVGTGTGTTFAATFPDDGAYSVVLTVTDPQGAAGTATTAVTVANVAPTASVTGSTTIDEGDTAGLTATGTDPSSVDQAALTLSWIIQNAAGGLVTSGNGAAISHAFPDDGVFTVTVTATDPQGASSTGTATLTVNNVNPTITTSAPTTATEGTQWTYTPAVTDPGAEIFSWSIVATPNIAIVPSSGFASWTPTLADAGSHAVSITVSDNDGGTFTESFTLVVDFIDDDNDSLPDTWEVANGLDPTVDDSGLDPDGDGVTNLDEWNGGTDPNSFDGPSAPPLTSPIDGAEVAVPSPELVWQNASDPQNDPLTYDVEVYSDASMSTLLTSASGLPEHPQLGSWTVDVTLPENGEIHWRARANDGNVDGPWANLEDFFVNEVNEEPLAPVATSPLDGDHVSLARPVLSWADAVDPDRDDLTYTVRLQNEARDTVISTATGISAQVRDLVWEVDVELEEDTWYSWDVQATDEHGLVGAWSDPQDFFVNLTNAAPGGVTFTAPEDGARVESVQPTLTVTEAVDVEADTLTYSFQLDTTPDFASADLIGRLVAESGTGEVSWDLSITADELRDNVLWYARARAEDEPGAVGEWATISFFVLGPNDPPAIPVLMAPEDETEERGGAPTLVAAHAEDPEGDAVTYSFRVSNDIEGVEVVASVEGVEPGAGPEGTADQTSWTADPQLVGTVYWTAQAVDEGGAASDWAEPRVYVVEPDPVDPDPTDGCDCEQASLVDADGAGGWALLALLGVVGVRRRR